jgi:hypothetical protein
VESLFASGLGLEPLREMVGVIQDRGHDVQLHVHSEWLPITNHTVLPGRSGLNLNCFSEDEQRLLIGNSFDNLEAAGVANISAFRAGNMGADIGTLRALARAGIPYDSSYFAPYLKSHCHLGDLGNICQPVKRYGVVEFPVSSFTDFPGHMRPMQLCACSSSEIEHGLLQAWRNQWRCVVLLWHSFELIKRPSYTTRQPALDRLVNSRFVRLCRFLAEHRDKFRTAMFADQSWSEIAESQRPQLRSPIWRTAWRVAEQAVGAVRGAG